MSQHRVREHAAHAEAARGHHQSGTRSPPIRPSRHCTAALEHQQPRCAMLKLRRPPCFSQLCAAQRASSAAPGGPMACSASREAEAGRVSASRAGGHAPRTGERVARKSASRACFCVTSRFLILAMYINVCGRLLLAAAAAAAVAAAPLLLIVALETSSRCLLAASREEGKTSS